MTDYPARSRGFLLAYTLACICLGGAMVAAVFVYGPKVEAPAEEAAPVITDQHWSGTE